MLTPEQQIARLSACSPVGIWGGYGPKGPQFTAYLLDLEGLTPAVCGPDIDSAEYDGREAKGYPTIADAIASLPSGRSRLTWAQETEATKIPAKLEMIRDVFPEMLAALKDYHAMLDRSHGFRDVAAKLEQIIAKAERFK